jgi:DNA-binding response OmpR family regulator
LLARLLLVSADEVVGQLKVKILQRARHDVSTVTSFDGLLATVKQARFDLIIIGYTVPAKEKLRIWHALVDCVHPTPKVLEIFRVSPEVEGADGYVRIDDGPEALIAAANELTEKRRRAASA